MTSYVLVQLILSVANVYSMVIFVYVLMSWIPTNRGIIADVYQVLGRLCDPYLNLFRRFIPPIGGMVDISPIVALLVLQLAVRLIVGFIV